MGKCQHELCQEKTMYIHLVQSTLKQGALSSQLQKYMVNSHVLLWVKEQK